MDEHIRKIGKPYYLICLNALELFFIIECVFPNLQFSKYHHFQKSVLERIFIKVRKMEKTITKIYLKDNLILIAFFDDGEIVSFDIKTLFDKYPIFKQLENKTLFLKAKIDIGGYGISWNDKIDLSSDGIYFKGKHISRIP